MKYFKILENNELIGVISSNNFFIEDINTNILLASNDTMGQFVEYNKILYRDYWMQPISSNYYTFYNASIIEISKENYFAFILAQRNNEIVILDDNELEQESNISSEIISLEPDTLLEFIRESKLTEMSRACRNTIESGFDLAIHGAIHHFSLTTQDQLNLMSLSAMAQTLNLIPYHADGEESEFYTSEEINEIANTATNFKNYNLAYYNSLKTYINALETIEEIAAITYGTPIPDEYKSDVLKLLEY